MIFYQTLFFLKITKAMAQLWNNGHKKKKKKKENQWTY